MLLWSVAIAIGTFDTCARALRAVLSVAFVESRSISFFDLTMIFRFLQLRPKIIKSPEKLCGRLLWALQNASTRFFERFELSIKMRMAIRFHAETYMDVSLLKDELDGSFRWSRAVVSVK